MDEYRPILNLLQKVKENFVRFNDNITRLSEIQSKLEDGTNSLDKFISAMSIQKELMTFTEPEVVPVVELAEKADMANKETRRKSIFLNKNKKETKRNDLPVFDYVAMKFDRFNYRRPTIASLAKPVKNTNNGSISLTTSNIGNDSSDPIPAVRSKRTTARSSGAAVKSNPQRTTQTKRVHYLDKEVTQKKQMFSLEKCREFLPKKYQTDQHVQKLEQVLRFIGQSKNDGRKLTEIVNHIQCGTIVTNDYLNALIKLGEIQRINNGQLGMIYKLEPYKYIKYLDPR